MWRRDLKLGVANSDDKSVTFTSDFTLHPIKEEQEENDWAARANLTMVVGGGVSDRDITCLSMTEHVNTHAFLDSGANAHFFKNQDLFESFDEGKGTTVQTACNKSDSQALVGKVKALSYGGNGNIALEKGSSAILCESLFENLVSVGKICDNET